VIVAKVVVVGRAEAGKSTLVNALTARAMNLAVRGRTVGMDHGLLERGADALALVGLPGQKRFAPVRDVLVSGARGALFVHPAGEAYDPATVALLSGHVLRNVPYLVFVNRREATPAGVAEEPPPGLRPPKAILSGDLAQPGPILRDLQEATWRLLGL